MTFPYKFSTVADSLRPSPIRELFKLIARPGMISFAGGLPDPAIFPVDEFASCASILSSSGRAALQYGATEGYRPLVEQITERMEPLLHRPVATEEVLVTSGSQQAMHVIATVLLNPGDVVIVEAPTYPGALHTFRLAGARFALVECDADGMRVDLLPDVIEQVRAATGRAPRLIYTIINFSNPSGACMSVARRRRLAEIAAAAGIPVLEDDPYGELRYGGSRIPALATMASQGVIYASSFSKILAPGVRVAWAVGDRELIRRMVIAKQGMDLCTSVVAQALTAEYCRRGFLDSHLARIRAHYAAKADAMAHALVAELPAGSLEFTAPQGGFFFWTRLASGDSRTVFERAVSAGVAFLPGDAFFPAREETIGSSVDGSPFARLCFTFAQPGEIVEGCRRLASAVMRPEPAEPGIPTS